MISPHGERADAAAPRRSSRSLEVADRRPLWDPRPLFRRRRSFQRRPRRRGDPDRSRVRRRADIGTKPPGQYSAADLEEVTTYERDASRYGQALLHETGIRDLDHWLADLSASDITYLEHFYATGIKGSLADFRKTGQPPLNPLPIPDFKPQRLSFRADGVVI
jgi:hypothetical protein